MDRTEYLIIGSSHAGLSAAEEIRVNDPEGSVTMVTMEDCLPYSPTILPYIISGRVPPDRAFLQGEDYFEKNRIRFLRGKAATQVDAKDSVVMLSRGDTIRYRKLLVATGAEPTIPRVENLPHVPFLELRTMADALNHLRVSKARSAIVMGTGLVGMHAVENFTHRGIEVDVVRARAKKNPRILPSYFDEECSRIIQHVFESHGARFHLDHHAVRVAHERDEFILTLSNGREIRANMLLLCTGVRPRTELLGQSGVDLDEGVLVDGEMRTSINNVWAAGDVAQADDFFGPSKILNAILPDAVLQGKIAGTSMSGGKLDSDYAGGIPMNTFNFFGNRAFSVGMNNPPDGAGYAINREISPSRNIYQKMVFQGSTLVGMSAVNSNLDPGIILMLIAKRVDLGEARAEFVKNPVNLSRRLMWKVWR